MRNNLPTCFYRVVVLILLLFISTKEIFAIDDSVERAALVAFYNATGGNSWINMDSEKPWLINDNTSHFSNWDGVIVSPVTGDVVEISLLNRNVVGDIPENFSDLEALELLILGNNQLTSLPASFGTLSSLAYLSIDNNQLTSLPSLNGLINLEVLNVENNQLTSLPSLNGLIDLHLLRISGNQLTSLPSLSSLTALKYLYVSSNQLTSLPTFDNLTSLQDLYLHNNQLTSLPNLENLTTLQTLKVESNNLGFGDLEPYLNISTYSYCPQNLLGQPQIYNVTSGDNQTLTHDMGGTNTVYQWKKETTPNNWVSVSGANSNTFTFTAITPSEAGNYRLTGTNSQFPSCSLITQAFTINVTEAESCNLVVNSLADNIADDGVTTLREAILCANENPDQSTISFDFSSVYPNTNGKYVIELGSSLPTITESVIIDGGYLSGEGEPLVEVDGNGFDILSLYSASNSETRNLLLKNGVVNLRITQSDYTKVQNIWSYSGKWEFQNSDYVEVKGIRFNTDGKVLLDDLYNTSRFTVYFSDYLILGGVFPEDKNIFGGDFELSQSNNSRINNNYFGFIETGLKSIDLGDRKAFTLANSNNNIIGEDKMNLFSPFYNVFINSSDNNTFVGNYIGVTSTGELLSNNEYDEINNWYAAISISYGSDGNIIGTDEHKNKIVCGSLRSAIAIGYGGNYNTFSSNVIKYTNEINTNSYDVKPILTCTTSTCYNESIPTPTNLTSTNGILSGDFVGHPIALTRIELFASNQYGTEATEFLGAATSGFTINGATTSWSFILADPNYVGYVVATATDVNGNTSELSGAIKVNSSNESPFAVSLPNDNIIYVPVGSTEIHVIQFDDPNNHTATSLVEEIEITSKEVGEDPYTVSVDRQQSIAVTNESVTPTVVPPGDISVVNTNYVPGTSTSLAQSVITIVANENMLNQTYSVDLTATDDGDPNMSTTETIQIEVVKFTWFYSGCDRKTVNFKMEGTDPENTTYTWNFGDGTTPVNVGMNKTVSHTFAGYLPNTTDPNSLGYNVSVTMSIPDQPQESFSKYIKVYDRTHTIDLSDRNTFNEWQRNDRLVGMKKKNEVIDFNVKNVTSSSQIIVQDDHYYAQNFKLKFVDNDHNRNFVPAFEFDEPHIHEAEGTWCITSNLEKGITTEIRIDKSTLENPSDYPKGYLQYVVMVDKAKCSTCDNSGVGYEIYPVEYVELPIKKADGTYDYHFVANVPIRTGLQYMTIGKLSAWDDAFTLKTNGEGILPTSLTPTPGLIYQVGEDRNMQLPLPEDYVKFVKQFYGNAADDFLRELKEPRQIRYSENRGYNRYILLNKLTVGGSDSYLNKDILEYKRGGIVQENKKYRAYFRAFLYLPNQASYKFGGHAQYRMAMHIENTQTNPWFDGNFITPWYNSKFHFDATYDTQFGENNMYKSDVGSATFNQGYYPLEVHYVNYTSTPEGFSLGVQSNFYTGPIPNNWYFLNKEFNYPIVTIGNFAKFNPVNSLSSGNEKAKVLPYATKEISLRLTVPDMEVNMAEGDYIRFGHNGNIGNKPNVIIASKPYQKVGRTWFVQVATTHQTEDDLVSKIYTDFKFEGPFDVDEQDKDQLVLVISRTPDFLGETKVFGLDNFEKIGVPLGAVFSEGGDDLCVDCMEGEERVKPNPTAHYYVTLAKIAAPCNVGQEANSKVIGFQGTPALKKATIGHLQAEHDFEGYAAFDPNEYTGFEYNGELLSEVGDAIPSTINLTPSKAQWCFNFSNNTQSAHIQFSMSKEDMENDDVKEINITGWYAGTDYRRPAVIILNTSGEYVTESGLVLNEKTQLYESSLVEIESGYTVVFGFIHSVSDPVYTQAPAGLGMAATNYEEFGVSSDQLTISNPRDLNPQEYILFSHNDASFSHTSVPSLPTGIEQAANREWLVQLIGTPGNVDIAIALDQDFVNHLTGEYQYFLTVDHGGGSVDNILLKPAEGTTYMANNISLVSGDLIYLSYGIRALLEGVSAPCSLVGSQITTNATCEVVLRDIYNAQEDNNRPCNEVVSSAKLYVTIDFGDDYNLGGGVISQWVKFNLSGESSTEAPVLLNQVSEIQLSQTQITPEQTYVLDITNEYVSNDLSKVILTVVTSSSLQTATRITTSFRIDKRDRIEVTEKPLVTLLNPMEGVSNGKTLHFEWVSDGCKAPYYQLQLLRLYNVDDEIIDDQVEMYADVDWEEALSIDITNGQTSIDLTMAEGTGMYLWRVRPVGNFYPLGDSRNNGTWSTHPKSREHYFNSSDLSNNYLFYYEEPEEDVNFIYSRTFTENTRIKESITYANKLNQVKQTQTRLPSNENDKLIVSQTVYDFAGRASLQTLPVPLNESELGYVDGVVQKGTEAFRDKHFDSDDNYLNFNFGAAVTGGAILDYYDNSSDLQIPSSEGFPYTRSLFYNDGRGRIIESGSVGKELSVGQGHNTRVDYGMATDDELIRIFGQEAPKGNTVIKVTTTDPNNVSSVSYVSKDGKTLATSLTENLLTKPLEQVGTDVFNSTQGFENNPGTDAFTLFSAQQYTSKMPYDAFSVDVAVSPAQILAACNEYCVSCGYTIQVVITDASGVIYETTSTIPASHATTEGECVNASMTNQIEVTAADIIASAAWMVPESNPPVPVSKIPPGTYNVFKYVKIDDSEALTQASEIALEMSTTFNGYFTNLKTILEAASNLEGSYWDVLEELNTLLYNENENPYEVQVLDVKNELAIVPTTSSFDFMDEVHYGEEYLIRFTSTSGCCEVDIPLVYPTPNPCAVNNANKGLSIWNDAIKIISDNNPNYSYANLYGESKIGFAQPYSDFIPETNSITYNATDNAPEIIINNLITDMADCQKVWDCSQSAAYNMKSSKNIPRLSEEDKAEIKVKNDEALLEMGLTNVSFDIDQPKTYFLNELFLCTGTMYEGGLDPRIPTNQSDLKFQPYKYIPFLTDAETVNLASGAIVNSYNKALESMAGYTDDNKMPDFNLDYDTDFTTINSTFANPICPDEYEYQRNNNMISVLSTASGNYGQVLITWSDAEYAIFLATAKAMVNYKEVSLNQAQLTALAEEMQNKKIEECEKYCEGNYDSFLSEIKEVYNVATDGNYFWESLQGEPLVFSDLCCTAQSLVESCQENCAFDIAWHCPTSTFPQGEKFIIGTPAQNEYLTKIVGGNYDIDKPSLVQQSKRVISDEMMAVAQLLKEYIKWVEVKQVAVPVNGYYDLTKWDVFTKYNEVWRSSLVGIADDYYKYALIDNNQLVLKSASGQVTHTVTLSGASGASFDKYNSVTQPVISDINVNEVLIYFGLAFPENDVNDNQIFGNSFSISGVGLYPGNGTISATVESTSTNTSSGSLYLYESEGYSLVQQNNNENPSTCVCDLPLNSYPKSSTFGSYENYYYDETIGERFFSDGIASTTVTGMEYFIPSPNPNNGYYLSGNADGVSSDGKSIIIHWDNDFNLTSFTKVQYQNAVTNNSHFSVQNDKLGIVANGLYNLYTPGFSQFQLNNDGSIGSLINEVILNKSDGAIYNVGMFGRPDGGYNVFAYANCTPDTLTYKRAPILNTVGTRNLMDYWVLTIDENLNYTSDVTYNGVVGPILPVNTGDETSPNLSLKLSDGNYLLVATTMTNAGFNKSQDKICSGELDKDLWLVKIDQITNEVIWDITIGSCDNEGAYKAVELSNGNILARGYQDNNYKYIIVDGVTGELIKHQGLPYDDDFIVSNQEIAKPFGEVEIDGQQAIILFGQKNGYYTFMFFDLELNYLGEKQIIEISALAGNYYTFEFTRDKEDIILFGLNNNNGVSAVIRKEFSCSPQPVAIRWNITRPSGSEGINRDIETFEQREASKAEYVLGHLETGLEACELNIAEELHTLYKDVCLSKYNENASVSVSHVSGHYTLYYYDRAGNLTQTVPPAGVEVIDDTEISATRVNGFAQRKDLNPGVPPHRMPTKYMYNSLGQLISQSVPDHKKVVGGTAVQDFGGETHFIYNEQGLLRFSQNPKQTETGKFSYTKYDALARIIEVGEYTGDFTSAESSADGYGITSFPTTVSLMKERTFTEYNTPSNGLQTYRHPERSEGSIVWKTEIQRYLSNRISHTYTDDDGNPSTINDQVHTYYSYDPHGNVEWLIQDLPGFGKTNMAYEYDLISGNVLQVKYQEGKADQFYHRYSYDADNRIEQVETSTDGIIWDKDANYKYYAHGPLKRTEIGEDKIQGIDYTYTIQGWLKGINHPIINNSSNANLINDEYDPGKDGLVSNESGNFARDVFGFQLNYFNGDFKKNLSPFDASFTVAGAVNAFAPYGTGLNTKNLYNGNISSTIAMTESDNQSGHDNNLMLQSYQYDYLNRLKSSKVSYLQASLTDWETTPTNRFATSYNYDANGNITHLDRYDKTGTPFDELSYKYNYKDGNVNNDFRLVNNKLNYVDDALSNTLGYGDIEAQPTTNYNYDAIGNLTKDESEGITSIEWTVYGKVKKVTTADGVITFAYDAAGNRVSKTNTPNQGNATTSYYVLDASGNQMAVYDETTTNTKLVDMPIYGSERIGSYAPQTLIDTDASSIKVGDVIISEVLVFTPNQYGSVPDGIGNNTYGQYVVLYNTTNKFIEIANISIRLNDLNLDNENLRWIYLTNTTGELAPKQHLVVYQGDLLNSATCTALNSRDKFLFMFNLDPEDFTNTQFVEVSTMQMKRGRGEVKLYYSSVKYDELKYGSATNYYTANNNSAPTCPFITNLNVIKRIGYDGDKLYDKESWTTGTVNLTNVPAYLQTYSRTLALKTYEFKDHLGNVRATTSDRKLLPLIGDASKYTFVSDLQSKTDYYPFGWAMPGRKFSGVNYRYGFNGKEEDPEWGKLHYELREYDARIGRMTSIDPRMPEYPWQSPYAYYMNSPIATIDFLGGGCETCETDEERSYVDSRSESEVNKVLSTGSVKDYDELQELEAKTENQLIWDFNYGNIDESNSTASQSPPSTETPKYVFESGEKADLNMSAATYVSYAVGPLGASTGRMRVWNNTETIESESWIPNFSYGIGSDVFSESKTDAITFHQTISGESLLEVFNSVKLIETQNFGGFFKYTEIRGYDNATNMNLIYSAKLYGAGLTIGWSGDRSSSGFKIIK